jgi:tRNA threonylcarbamoyladenosine biosynthesis protein TsaE
MERIFSLNQIDLVARELLDFLQKRPSKVIAMYGEMGAGKTTFVNALVRALGSIDTTGSPTFSIINQYADANGKPIFHMDWYRLKDEEEALQAGVEDPMYSGHWCFVEWPQKAEWLLPEQCIKLELTTLDPNTRELIMKS